MPSLAGLGLSLLLVVGLELCARLGFFVADDVLQWGANERIASAPAFRHVAYDARKVLEEQEDLPPVAYEPYVGWISRAFDGTYHSIGPDGRRRTVDAAEVGDGPEIWMLGGSTTFGTGVPDEETIPSHLSRALARRGYPARVLNLGQRSFVSTQELVLLLLELQRGRTPDIAVFYDGFNDVMAAEVRGGSPGHHLQTPQFRLRLETAWGSLLRSSALFRASLWLRARGLGRRGCVDCLEPETSGRRAAAVWLANYDLARNLAADLDFDVLFLLQPSRSMEGRSSHPSTASDLPNSHQVMRDTVRQWRSVHPEAAVHDLTEVFAEVEVPVYFDDVHVTGVGNRIVADRIATLVTPLLPPVAPGSSSEGGDLRPSPRDDAVVAVAVAGDE